MTLSDVVNVSLLANPYNWIVVALMLAIGVFALNLLAEPLATLRGAQSVAV
jgi:hypothetical protein